MKKTNKYNKYVVINEIQRNDIFINFHSKSGH